MRNAVILCLFVLLSAVRANREYTHHWVAKIEGGEEVAKRVARDLGFTYEKKIDSFVDHYRLIRNDLPKINQQESPHLTRSLLDVDEVKWAQQQRVWKFSLRGVVPESNDLKINNPQEIQNLVNQFLKDGAEADIAITIRKHFNGPSTGQILTSGIPPSTTTNPLPSAGTGSLLGPVSQTGIGNNAQPIVTGTKPATGSVSNSGSGGSNSGSGGNAVYQIVNGKPAFVYSDGYVQFINNNGLVGQGNQGNIAGAGNQGHSVSPGIHGTTSLDQEGTSKLGTFSTDPAPKSTLTTYEGPTKHVHLSSRKKSAYEKKFNDPKWTDQWYCQDQRTKDIPVMDHNVVPVYDMGITGKGIKIAVVDDGLLGSHPDLAANYLADLSVDMTYTNFEVGTSVPAVNPETHKLRSHGTKCASEIAMVANNKKCGVGIAYNSKIAGVKKSSGQPLPIHVQSECLKWKHTIFDIYSCSWGPNDDGMTMDLEDDMTHKAFFEGVTEGRNGKGVLYFFAGGNGREDQDNCYADGMVNHLYTMGIASVSNRGKTTYYSERCSAIFAATYSGGGDEGIHTVEMDGGCAGGFSGTSAATPIASGLAALALEARPSLTYRDVMHIIAWTSEVAPLASNERIWYKNGAGFWVSNDFGFGLMNAKNMVTAAKSWVTVPKRHECEITVMPEEEVSFSPGFPAVIDFMTLACQDRPENSVVYLEQLMVKTDISYPHRGAIYINITSPMGTETELAEVRPRDYDPYGLQWTIKSLRTWGENPKGKWKIEVFAEDFEPKPYAEKIGAVHSFILSFYGTSEKPEHYNQPRTYAAFRLPDGQTN